MEKVSEPVKERDLGLRSIRKINKAIMLSLPWKTLSIDSQWSNFLRNKFLTNSTNKVRYHKSSIYVALNHFILVVWRESKWLVGNGATIHLWNDNWLRKALVDKLDIPPSIHSKMQANVANIIHLASWKVPQSLVDLFPNLEQQLRQNDILRQDILDKLV